MRCASRTAHGLPGRPLSSAATDGNRVVSHRASARRTAAPSRRSGFRRAAIVEANGQTTGISRNDHGQERDLGGFGACIGSHRRCMGVVVGMAGACADSARRRGDAARAGGRRSDRGGRFPRCCAAAPVRTGRGDGGHGRFSGSAGLGEFDRIRRGRRDAAGSAAGGRRRCERSRGGHADRAGARAHSLHLEREQSRSG